MRLRISDAEIIQQTPINAPAQRLTNEELAKMVDTTDEWIVERTGIKARRIAASYETASSMGAIAATKAIEAAKITKDQIGLIVVAMITVLNTFQGKLAGTFTAAGDKLPQTF